MFLIYCLYVCYLHDLNAIFLVVTCRTYLKSSYLVLINFFFDEIGPHISEQYVRIG